MSDDTIKWYKIGEQLCDPKPAAIDNPPQVDVVLLVQELAMADGYNQYLKSEVKRLQARVAVLENECDMYRGEQQEMMRQDLHEFNEGRQQMSTDDDDYTTTLLMLGATVFVGAILVIGLVLTR